MSHPSAHDCRDREILSRLEAQMSKVSPYHSSNPSDPDVYHDHSDCPTGQQIPDRNRVSGTGGYRRCTQCTAKG